MRLNRRYLLLLALGVAAGAFLMPLRPVAAEAARRHLTLDKAIPGPDSTAVGPVTEVRLFFSEAPQMRATTIRIVDSGRSLVTSSPPSAFAEDQRQIFVTLQAPLPPGAYVVQWRIMAQDGHVLRDQFSFRVVAE